MAWCDWGLTKTNAPISFAVTAKLICVFVFTYAKSRFSHDEARLSSGAVVRSVVRPLGIQATPSSTPRPAHSFLEI